jgi:adenylate kinase
VTQRAVRKGSGASSTTGTARIYQVKAPAPRILVMLGGPGAGKGTQADVLAEQLGLPHVSSGELFRAHIREGTPLGKEVQRYMDRGALAPDDVTVRMIAERLGQPDAAGGVILDGFPRTVSQAQALDKMLASNGNRVAGALYIQVEPEELVKRLSGRRVCSGTTQHIYHVMFHPPKVEGICDIDGTPLTLRADDEPDTVRSRLTKQLPPMFEVVDYYSDRGLLCAIRGDQSIDLVTDALLHAVETACKVP